MKTNIAAEPINKVCIKAIVKQGTNYMAVPGMTLPRITINSHRRTMIVEIVCKHHNVTYEQINKVDVDKLDQFGNIRMVKKDELVKPRHNIYWLLSYYTTFSLREIGETFTVHHDHSTVISAKTSWQDRIDTDKRLLLLHNTILAELKSKLD